jgi:multidrug efflux system membrane fusion protein
LKLKAIFQNQDTELFPNQFVNARLLVDTQRGVTLVPTAAIQRNAQGAFVYVIGSDNTATLHTVTVGTTDGNTAAVQNVNAGDVIAVNGFDKLQNGGKVTINNASGNGGSNGASGSPASGANKNSPAPASANPSSTGGSHQ